MDGGGAICRAAVTLSEHGEARVLAAIDEAGGISLVGCPAQLTRPVLTVVAQQLLVWNGRLWRMPLEEFSTLFEKGLKRSLGEYFSGKAASDWSEDGFQAGLKQSLERGRFPVVLLLPETNPDVVEVIAHLRSHNLAVKSLGAELYESCGVEVVMPKVLAVAEPGPHEGADPARAVRRPPQSPSRAQRYSQISSAQVANVGMSDAGSQPGTNSAQKMPWSDQLAPPVVDTRPATGGPAAAPQSGPKPPPAAKPAWDGTMPGVMAGKRPAPKPSPETEARKGQEQSMGRR